jgi:hypothetical protein
MKPTGLLMTAFVVAGALVAFGQATTPRLEGTWELKSLKGTAQGKEYVLGGNVSGSQLKTYSKGHFLFVGRFAFEGQESNSFGGGTYTLNGEDYTETITYHAAAATIGKTLHFKLVVVGDTLTLTGPISAEEQASLGNRFTEVYLKKD